MSAASGGPEDANGFAAAFASTRRRLAQPLSEAAHRLTGAPWHRQALAVLAVSAAAQLAEATGEAYHVIAALHAGSTPSLAAVAITVAVQGAIYAALLTHQTRFSRKASRNPFIAYDPFYRSRLTGSVMGAFWMTSVLQTAITVSTLLVELAATWTHAADRPDATTLLREGLDVAAAATLMLGILLAACERSWKGRANRKERREARAGSDRRAVA